MARRALQARRCCARASLCLVLLALRPPFCRRAAANFLHFCTHVRGGRILHMTRSFGSHAKSEFDRTLSCGFDMPSDSVRRTQMLRDAQRPAQHWHSTTQPR